jgi:ubiquinone/menaquinone biosynthesis C-methylase UbiE
MSEAQSNTADPALTAAENYEKRVVTYTTGPFTAILLEHANPQPGERVVDIACGTGVVARHAAPRVGTTGTIVAVDINPAMLTVGRSLPAPEGATIEWREGSALELPLPNEAFDLALCQAGLQFVPDRLKALQEIHRTLRPGGRVALSVWRSPEYNPVSQLVWGTIARHLNTSITLLTPAMSLGDAGELSTLLTSAGFTDVTIVARSYTVREPVTHQLIASMLPAVAAIVPTFAAMEAEERAALAQAVETEIEPELQTYVDGDEQLYPMSTHIALAFKH